MKLLNIFIGWFLIIPGVLAQWEKPISVSEEFYSQCYETVHEISGNILEEGKVYQSYLNFSEGSFTAIQGDKYLPTKIFSKGGYGYVTEFLNTQKLELPNDYQSILELENDFFTLNVDKSFELDVCFYEPGNFSCGNVLEEGKLHYDIQIQSDNYIPVYNVKTGLVQNDEKFWKYSQDQEKYISVYDISDLENYNIRDIKITFEPKNDEITESEEIKIFSLHAIPKKREFLFRPTTKENIKIYSDYKFDNLGKNKEVFPCNTFSDYNGAISFSDIDKYELYSGIENNDFEKIDLYDGENQNKKDEKIDIMKIFENPGDSVLREDARYHKIFNIIILFGIIIFCITLVSVYKFQKKYLIKKK